MHRPVHRDPRWKVTAMPVLSQVGVRYPGGVEALRGVDLRIEGDRFTVLLGPSGAGKSTLLRCLNGLARPTEGSVRVEGLGDLSSPAALRAHRRRTAMVFQDHRLIGAMTALGNVLIGRLGHHGWLRTLLPLPRRDRALALECLDRVGLLDKALSRADALSGGQRQRVGIARALAQEPTMILADEPVASLDPATADRVLGLLHGICLRDRIGAVVSLHQLDLARRYADRVIGVAGGRVVFDGAPAELTPRHVAAIYGEAPAPAPSSPAPPSPAPARAAARPPYPRAAEA
jgi:phosphonate transport system ATP-binding protein